MTTVLRAWLAARSERERRLVAARSPSRSRAWGSRARSLRDDHATLVARVAAHERELAQVRRLAATLVDARTSDDVPSLTARLDAAAGAAGIGDRVASMTPAGGVGADASLALRVSGASLAETVALLHALENGGAPVAIARLGLRKHPDDPGRFDVTLEVEAVRTTP